MRGLVLFWPSFQHRHLHLKVKGVVAASPLSRRFFSCAIFSAPQMFMNNVHRSPLEVGLEVVEERARWITRRGDLTGRTELCDHSKVLIISLTLPILPIMKENRWLRPGLCSPASPKAELGWGKEMNFERAANWLWQHDRQWHRFCSKTDVLLIDYQYFKQSDENEHQERGRDRSKAMHVESCLSRGFFFFLILSFFYAALFTNKSILFFPVSV